MENSLNWSTEQRLTAHSPLQPISAAKPLIESTITAREREVLTLLANGFSTKQMAGKLRMSAHTAETHRKKLLSKFDAKNSAELIKKASKVFWLE